MMMSSMMTVCEQSLRKKRLVIYKN